MKMIKVTAYGSSMYPFFKSGDFLYLIPIQIHKLQVNDFITFQKKGVYITHRVIYIPFQKNFVITKGDTNIYHDGKIYPDKIIGKVVKVKRERKILFPNTIYQIQSFFYLQEIKKINKTLRKKNIDFVFLKGLPLHLYYEKSIPKRIYADCDILIEKSQQKIIHDILTKLGYAIYDDSLSKIHKLLKNKENAFVYYKVSKSVTITLDVHLEASFMMHQIGSLEGLYPQKLLDQLTKNLLSNKRFITLKNNDVFPILSSTYIVIYLALHLFHHNFQGYYRYEFLNIVLKKEKLKIHLLTKYIQEYKIDFFTLPVFFLLWKYYKNQKAKQIMMDIPLSKHNLQRIKKLTYSIDIFSGGSRMENGIKRFYYLYLNSPQHFFQKISIFTSPSVFYSLLWISLMKLLASTKQIRRFPFVLSSLLLR